MSLSLIKDEVLWGQEFLSLYGKKTEIFRKQNGKKQVFCEARFMCLICIRKIKSLSCAVYIILWYGIIGRWTELIITGSQLSPIEVKIDNREYAGLFRMMITMCIIAHWCLRLKIDT